MSGLNRVAPGQYPQMGVVVTPPMLTNGQHVLVDGEKRFVRKVQPHFTPGFGIDHKPVKRGFRLPGQRNAGCMQDRSEGTIAWHGFQPMIFGNMSLIQAGDQHMS